LGICVVNRYILLSFLVMGWGYYELSGGADFVPERRTVLAKAPEAASDPVPTLIAANAAAPEPQAEADPLEAVTIVTRAETTDIDALPEADSIAADGIATDEIAFEADSVAEALAQALGEPVLNTGEPAAQPEADQIAALPETEAQPDAAQTGDGGALREVTGDTVNLREGPGTNFTVLDRLTRGTAVSLLDIGPDGWVYVEANGQIGWMSADFIGPAI
jgi:uncharacterized protein YgiM (DUF1202 family)